MVTQKEGVIVELRDEAYTLWASSWLAFWCKASKVFLGLSFDFPILVEDEIGESEFDGEDDLRVSLTAPNSAIFPGDLEFEVAQAWASDRLFIAILLCYDSI